MSSKWGKDTQLRHFSNRPREPLELVSGRLLYGRPGSFRSPEHATKILAFYLRSERGWLTEGFELGSQFRVRCRIVRTPLPRASWYLFELEFALKG